MTNIIEMPSRKQRLVEACDKRKTIDWPAIKEEIQATALYRETMAEKARSRQQLEAHIRHSVACLYGLMGSECADAYKDETTAKNKATERLETYINSVVTGLTNGGKSALCRND